MTSWISWRSIVVFCRACRLVCHPRKRGCMLLTMKNKNVGQPHEKNETQNYMHVFAISHFGYWRDYSVPSWTSRPESYRSGIRFASWCKLGLYSTDRRLVCNSLICISSCNPSILHWQKLKHERRQTCRHIHGRRSHVNLQRQPSLLQNHNTQPNIQ